MKAHRLDFNDSLKGQVKVSQTRTKALGVCVHFTSGSDQPTYDGRRPPEHPVENSVFWLQARNNRTAATKGVDLGYQCIISHGVIWTLAGPLQVVSHARGYNTSHIGIAIKHEGLRTRAITGETVPAFHRKTGKAMHQRRYDPADLEAAAYHVAGLLQTYCGGRPVDVADRVVFHDDFDASKNDPGPAFPRAQWLVAVTAIIEGRDLPVAFADMEPSGFDYEST